MTDSPEGGCRRMVVEAAFPTNPEKGRTNKRTTTIQTVQGRVDRWQKMHEFMAPDKPHRFVKPSLDSIIYKPQNIYTYTNKI